MADQFLVCIYNGGLGSGGTDIDADINCGSSHTDTLMGCRSAFAVAEFWFG
jgi:hypothetical protein